jgi:signal transduction histidine kinase
MNGERERPELLRRVDAIAPWVLDGVLALVILAPTLAISGHGLRRGTTNAHIAAVVSAAVFSTLPLLVRRRWPVRVLVVILIVAVAVPSAAVFSPPAFIAVYTIASRRPWRIAVLSAVAAAVALDLHRLLWDYSVPLLGVIAGIALAGAALALGLYQATRLAYFEQVHERATRLERERELLSRQAAAEERLRIARELHDVVAHNVSLMVIQAQALQAGATEPEAARSNAQTIAELGRNAMSEMHRTLELMRSESAAEERNPQPVLDDVSPLLERAHAAGVDVELSVKGSRRPLPAGVELSAYRIVQEALTNVIKHSGSDRAWVELSYGTESLELEVVDDGGGVGANSGASGSGHGLVGMRERVALFGGDFEAGPADGGGYRVRATLPYR